MTAEENRELDLKKRRFRRNAAIVSFVFMLLICSFFTLVGLFISLEKAQTISEFNSIIIVQLGVFGSIILGHLGFDYLDKMR